ncbi:MAG: dipeptidase [Kiritimatiellae bacterium]|nr:dipeptidase [Kiritimatiellia bacterium]
MNSDFAKIFESNRKRYWAELDNLLAIPSVSTDSAHEKDCLKCAEWLKEHFEQIGLETRLLATPSKPVVYGVFPGQPGSPVVLFYGHYDVQPVDPLEAWSSPPFSPTWRGDRLYARGAQDNKGQLFYVLKAVEELIRLRLLRVTLKVVLEGEEECGSRGLSSMLQDWKDLVKADVLLVNDVGMARDGSPAITLGLRGLVHLTVRVDGPAHDLHSGSHGGVSPNPAEALSRLLAGLHTPDGRVAVKSFYDEVSEPTHRERELARQVPFDANEYQAQTGVPPLAGESAFTPVERLAFRPTLEVNGIHAGYGGPGVKTIIPSVAVAKLTARLVPNQNPSACLEMIERHLRENVTPGIRISFPEKGIAGPGFRLNPDSHLIAKAAAVLEKVTGRNAVMLWEGGSIPIIAALREVSGGEPVIAGFGQDADRVHAPNESFSVEQFRQGFLYTAELLATM